MAFGISATTLFAISAAATVASVGMGLYQADQQRRAQHEANDRAKALAKKQAADAEQANNAANQKKPDLTAILAAQQKASGASGTLLTGPTGVDPNALSLGRSTLLGQ